MLIQDYCKKKVPDGIAGLRRSMPFYVGTAIDVFSSASSFSFFILFNLLNVL